MSNNKGAKKLWNIRYCMLILYNDINADLGVVCTLYKVLGVVCTLYKVLGVGCTLYKVLGVVCTLYNVSTKKARGCNIIKINAADHTYSGKYSQ